MPTPNWGPQAGVPMDDATFNMYLAQNPPGAPGRDGKYWGGANPEQEGPGYRPSQNVTGDSDAGGRFWGSVYSAQPAVVAPQQFNTANADQARLEQERVIQDLQAQAAGSLDTQAQRQLNSAYGDAKQQQSSLASTMRGGGAGAGMRASSQGVADLQRSQGGAQQMLKLQEQQAAQAMMAQMLAQQQGQDITQAQGLAGANMDQQALEAAMQQFYAQQGSAFDIERGQIAQEAQRARFGFDLEGNDLTNRYLQRGADMVGTVAGVAGKGGSKAPAPAPRDAGNDKQAIDDAFNEG